MHIANMNNLPVFLRRKNDCLFDVGKLANKTKHMLDDCTKLRLSSTSDVRRKTASHRQ